jgi:hypothetical protein
MTFVTRYEQLASLAASKVTPVPETPRRYCPAFGPGEPSAHFLNSSPKCCGEGEPHRSPNTRCLSMTRSPELSRTELPFMGADLALIGDWRSPSAALVSNGVLPKETHQRDGCHKQAAPHEISGGTGRQSRHQRSVRRPCMMRPKTQSPGGAQRGWAWPIPFSLISRR